MGAPQTTSSLAHPQGPPHVWSKAGPSPAQPTPGARGPCTPGDPPSKAPLASRGPMRHQGILIWPILHVRFGQGPFCTGPGRGAAAGHRGVGERRTRPPIHMQLRNPRNVCLAPRWGRAWALHCSPARKQASPGSSPSSRKPSRSPASPDGLACSEPSDRGRPFPSFLTFGARVGPRPLASSPVARCPSALGRTGCACGHPRGGGEGPGRAGQGREGEGREVLGLVAPHVAGWGIAGQGQTRSPRQATGVPAAFAKESPEAP